MQSEEQCCKVKMSGQLYHNIRLITDELTTDECRRLFYLCGALDTDTFSADPRAVHSVLCQMTNQILTELILRIKRYDLLRNVLSTNKGTVEGMLLNDRSVSDYRVLMADVSEDMDTDDLKSLTFLLRDILPKHKLENVQSFLDIVVELEKVEQLSSEKTDMIENCLMSIHRADLAKKIRRYQQKEPITKQGTFPAARLQVCKTASPNLFAISPATRNVRQVPKLCDKRTPRAYNQIEVYNMQSDPRGLCFIIDCVGTEGDQLEKTFKDLHFHVIKHKLLSVRDLLTTLMDAAHRRDHYRSCAFICCIISRSRSSDLLATDSHGHGLSLETVRHLFTADSCPGLAGKPKLFFIQSYDEPQRCVGYMGCGDQEVGELETDAPVVCCREKSVPADADIFWSHCWTPGQQLEMPNHRSVYLQALRSALDEGQKRGTHLIDVHTTVNREVYEHNSKYPGSYFLNLRHTLRKNVYLK
ncbi:CASP8 and FADD-like apoptosis regulator isoform X2 [Misgurnus anguillicaudatus]|uniref:CASP8 and FADD-like apoptosis regulator isoform X2 n=1 Tax=Misgurnus anguillicaudatus TaxID=75329 RepID=UPI003CCFB9DB